MVLRGLSDAQIVFLHAVDMGYIKRHFTTRGGGDDYRSNNGRRCNAMVKRLTAAGMVRTPAKEMGSFSPVVIELTDAGREAIR